MWILIISAERRKGGGGALKNCVCADWGEGGLKKVQELTFENILKVCELNFEPNLGCRIALFL